MATSKKFSELPAASSVGNGDLFAIAHEDAQVETGYVSQKLTAAQAGQKVNGDTEYPTSLPSFPENGQNPFAALEKLNQDIIDLYPVSTASGSIATFSTSLALPLVACEAEITAQQASGTPTPSNPLPISGWDEVNLTRCGKNLINIPNIAQTTKNGVTYSVTDNVLSINGTVTGGISAFNIYLVLPTEAYTFSAQLLSGSISGVNNSFNGFNSDGNRTWIVPFGNSGTTVSVTQIDNVARVGLAINTGAIFNNAKIGLQIEKNASMTPFAPYNGETKTIALPETIYGGRVDCIGGTGEKTWSEPFTFDGSVSVASVQQSGSTYYIRVVNDLAGINTTADKLTIKSDKFVTRAGVGGGDDHCYVTGNGAVLVCVLADQTITTKEQATEWFQNNPTTFIYELATPQDITGLTGVNFTTSEGVQQNIFADCGDISVSFKQGIQEYIDAQIAATQALIL